MRPNLQRSFLRIWSHLLKKSLLKTFLCSVTTNARTKVNEEVIFCLPLKCRESLAAHERSTALVTLTILL